MVVPPERLFARLAALNEAVTAIQLRLTEPKLGNPKYAMEHGQLTSTLATLQNQKIDLLLQYIDLLGGGEASPFAREGDWIINLTHVGPSPERTAYGRALVQGEAAFAEDQLIWDVFEHELERIVRSIDRLEGREERPRRRRQDDVSSVMQDDMAALLRALGLGVHARPVSPHKVMVTTIIPAVEALVKIVDGLDALKAMRR